MDPARLTVRIAAFEGVDPVARRLQAVVDRAIPAGRVRDLLQGAWLGHPVHPLLTDVPIGSFTSASVLDVLGGRRARRAANLLTAIGVVSAAPTAATGFSDWSTLTGAKRRIGVVHAVSNLFGVGLYAASWRARADRRRWAATVLGLAGMGVMTFGGLLGGHLAFGDDEATGHDPGLADPGGAAVTEVRREV